MVTADEVDVLDSSEDEESSDEEPSSDLAQEIMVRLKSKTNKMSKTLFIFSLH